MRSPADLVLSYPIGGLEVLSNKTEDGLDRHTLNKTQSQLLALVLEYLQYLNQAKRTDECNSWKMFQACAANIGHPKKLIQANYCKDRFCATCQWLRSRKAFKEAMTIGEHTLVHQPTLRFIFLTLTVPNLPLDELSGGTTAMMKAWQRLTQRKRVRDAILGYHRSLEVSYNPKRNDYHPHFHVLFAVPGYYFKGSKYINQSEWLSLWQQSARDERINQVNVKAVKPKEMTKEQEAEFLDTLGDVSDQKKEQSLKMTSMAGAFAECCKYGLKEWSLSKMGKDGRRKGATLGIKEERILRRAIMNAEIDFGLPGHIWIRENIEESARVLGQLRTALSHRRLVQHGGLLAEAKRELKLKDNEDEIDEEQSEENSKKKLKCTECGCDVVSRMAFWESFYNRHTGERSHRGKYVIPTDRNFEIPY